MSEAGDDALRRGKLAAKTQCKQHPEEADTHKLLPGSSTMARVNTTRARPDPRLSANLRCFVSCALRLAELVLHSAVVDVVVCGVLHALPGLGADRRPDMLLVVWVDVHVLGDGHHTTEVLQDHNVDQE